MIFVIKCSNPECSNIQARRIYDTLKGKRHICLNCRKSFTIKPQNEFGLKGNTFGPYKTDDEAMLKIAAMKEQDRQISSVEGFVTYKRKQ